MFNWALGLIFGPLLLWVGLLGLLALDPAGYAEIMEAYETEIAQWVAFLSEGYTSRDWMAVASARWNENYSL